MPAELGLVVEDAATGWCGAVVRVETVGGMRVVHLEDRHSRVRGFPLGPGFLLDGRPVTLTTPAPPAHRADPPTPGLRPPGTATAGPGRTASGSRAVPGAAARVARPSRLFVEGTHDAELVEHVWGDDLRIEGVVVEVLHGIDDLPEVIAEFQPSAEVRMGVLVDHLVPGSKESRLVDRIRANRAWREGVVVRGHPYVDVWQSVRPQRLGLTEWPAIPRGTSWKHGILAHLGWPHQTPADLAIGWRRILGTVRDYTDLEPSLLACVEELIDFVTVGVSR